MKTEFSSSSSPPPWRPCRASCRPNPPPITCPALKASKAPRCRRRAFISATTIWLYLADQLNNAAGNNAHVPDFRAFTYANVPRVIWITDTQVLGGYVGVDALASVRLPKPEGSRLRPRHIWRRRLLRRMHAVVASPSNSISAAGVGVWAPTGDSPTQPGPSTRAGSGLLDAHAHRRGDLVY